MPAAASSRARTLLAALRSRRVLALAASVLALAAAIVVAVALSQSASTEPPATGAAKIVPGDALAYVHISTDARRPAVRSALRLAGSFPSFPLLGADVLARLAGIMSGKAASGAGALVAFDSDIRPWLGKEAAIAFLNTQGSTAGSEIVLGVRSRPAARAFLLRSGATSAGTYDGVALYRLRTGIETAFVGGYLVLAQPPALDSAIAAGTGRIPSLARSRAYDLAAATEPAGRVLDAYFSAAGVSRLLVPQKGLVGALGALLYQPAALGSTVSLTPVGGGARVYVSTALSSRLATGGGAREFTPTLASELPAGSLLLLDARGLGRIAPRVLGAGSAAGIAGRLGPLLQRLGAALAAEGADVRGLETLFGGESAVAVAPVGTGPPTLIVIARTADERRARTELAGLEGPLANLFPAPSRGSGVVPEFTTHGIDGVNAHQLSLGPGLSIDYAVFRGLIVVSTSLRGIGAVARHAGTLAAESAYLKSLPGQPQPVTSLGFLDFNRLLSLLKSTGLTSGARYQALRPDLQRIQAVGVQTRRGQAELSAQIVFKIQ